MEGIVILVITLLAFAGIAAFFIVKAVKGPDLPKGDRYTYKHGNNKAVVVIEKNVPTTSIGGKVHYISNGTIYSGEEIAKKCAYSITATEDAFATKGIEKANVKTVVFLFKSDKAFESGSSWWAQWSKGVAAYSTDSGATIGAGYPMAVIRSKHIETVALRGQPACHEMIHILNLKAQGNYEHNHSDNRLWENFGSDTVENIAVENWKLLSN